MERPYNMMGLTLKSDMPEKRHKTKPKHFNSVADGIERRIEEKMKSRKSNRLTVFDAGRNLCISPMMPLQPLDVKLENRKLQLQKWKEEKEKTRKNEALKKKKPFLAGVYHAPIKFEPPPPLRVTRSQTNSIAKFSKEYKFTKTIIKDKKKTDTIFTFGSTKVIVKKNTTSTVNDKTCKEANNTRSTRSHNKIDNKKTTTNNKTKDVTQKKNKPKENPVTANKPQTDYKSKNNKNISAVKSTTETDSSDSKMSMLPMKIKKYNVKNKRNEKTIPLKDFETDSSDSKIDTPPMRTKKYNIKTKRNEKITATKPTDNTDRKMGTVPTKTKNHNSVKNKVNGKIKDSDSKIDTPLKKSKNKNNSIKNIENVSSDSKMNTPPMKKSKFPTKIKYTPMVKKNAISSTLDTDTSTDSSTQVTESPVPNSESKREIQLKSPKTPDEMYILNNSSPKVTMSRGKEASLKEKKQKLRDGLLADDSSDGQTVEHYRLQLGSEIQRITQLCSDWDDLSQKEILPDFIQEKILAAVGLARLLMSQKLQQFASLIEKCAFPEHNSPLVTIADLCGFWDLVFIQIEDIDMKFNALEKYREHNWKEDVMVEEKVVKKIVNRKAAVAKPPPTSRLRDIIAAARKAKNQPELCVEEKTFEAGFFQITSPVKLSPQLLATPKNKHSLLKAVVSSEAKKASANKNSYVMIRASMISKNVESNEPSPMQKTPTNLPDLEATPAKSILKNKSTRRISSRKSVKTVLFNDDDAEPIDNKENKTPKKQNKSLHRQDAVCSPKTRSQRKASTETMKKPNTASRKKDNDDLIDLDSPRVLRRSSRLSLMN